MIAAAYIRVSTDDQLEFSPDSQLERIRAYALAHDMRLDERFIFADNGISGRHADKRPAFLAMIAAAKAKPRPFDVILVWKFSRFARSREDSILYKSMLRRQCGISVISVSENTGDDKLSVLIEALIEAMDEFYSLNLAEEVKRGMTQKALKGGLLTHAPFGYRVIGGVYEPEPLEAPILRSVFERFANGQSILELTRSLNAAGVRTHRGGLIENRTVKYWLQNPAYIGKLRWTPTGAVGRALSDESIIVDGAHEPLISLDLWECVQSRLGIIAERYRGSAVRAKAPVHWLRGLLRCGICGAAMVFCNGYFYCSNRQKGSCSGFRGLCASRLRDCVIDALASVAADTLSLRLPATAAHSDAALLRERLDKLPQRLERLRAAYLAGVESLDDYRAAKADIEKKREELMRELSDTAALGRDLPLPCLGALDLLRADNADFAALNRLARVFIERVVCLDGRVVVVFCV